MKNLTVAAPKLASPFRSSDLFSNSPEEAVEVEAMAAQIIPSGETPGAQEARVIYFIDRVLVTFDSDKQPAYTQGLEDLRQRTQVLFPSVNRFSWRW